MKFCQPHWDKLRAAIESRGMGHLIAANGRDAAARVKSELEGRSEADDFDPLMGAHNMILAQAMDWCGLGLFTGDICPVCETLKTYPPIPSDNKYKSNESYFIDGPADAVLAIAHELNLMTP